ncbi:DUF6624 domain-containing protein [Neolewinella persica]|uniref:DUF6624 domain-containing protein n=1 Tax=Neolewinella persica TaxID=70998 RepID=UPI00036C522C|nr:DUF6624 domain-containing protein [Neolewinella persica]
MKTLILLCFFLTLPLTAWAQKAKEAAAVTYPAISADIIARRKDDQKLRFKYIKLIQKGKQATKKFKALTEELQATDRDNTNRMREIMAEIGWPTYDKVGRYASNTAWLLVQHADRQPQFQAQCLPLLKAAVDAEQATPSNYAYLYDRVRKSRGEKQYYATQPADNRVTGEKSFVTIEDEPGVQQRREAMGIEQTISDYATSMGFSYQVPDVETAEKREKDRQKMVADYLGKARAAVVVGDHQEAAENYLHASFYYGYLTAEDYVAGARAMALAENKSYASTAIYHLMKAALRGYAGHASFATSEDFAFLRTARPENWSDLMALVGEVNGE